MAALVVAASLCVLAKGVATLKDRRSPVIYRVSPDAQQLAVLTERELKKLQRRWLSRWQELLAIERALTVARDRGAELCQHGRVRDLRAVREARREAKYIALRLADAITWSKNQDVKKPRVVHAIKPAFRKTAQGFVSTRPAHVETPPPLSTLPFPLPEPPLHATDYMQVWPEHDPRPWRHLRRFRSDSASGPGDDDGFDEEDSLRDPVPMYSPSAGNADLQLPSYFG